LLRSPSLHCLPALARFCPVELESEEGETPASFHIAATEAKDSALVFRDGQAKLRQAHPQFLVEPPRVGSILETDNKIVGVAHVDLGSPYSAWHHLLDPKVQYVMQIDVRQHR